MFTSKSQDECDFLDEMSDNEECLLEGEVSTKTHSDSSKRFTSAEDEFRSRFIDSLKEKDVRRARIAVVVALLVCTVAITAFVYYYSHSSEHDQFVLRFTSDVEKIMPLIIWEVQYTFALMKQLSAQVTLSAIQANANFPQYTHPQFELPAVYAEGLGGFNAIGYSPLVKASERLAWETYSVLNQGWIQESKEYQVTHPDVLNVLHGTIQDHAYDVRSNGDETTLPIADQISKWEEGVLVPEPRFDDTTAIRGAEETLYAPLWQVSPPSALSINANLLSDKRIANLYSLMVASNQTIISEQYEVGDLFDFMYKKGLPEVRAQPHFFMMQPVYKGYTSDTSVVGFLIGVKVWESLFERLLPEDEHGVICVITDTCGNAMTFELDGPHATYLGDKDFHDPDFNQYRVSHTIEIYDAVVDSLCVHELIIYPTKEFQDKFETAKPIIYSFAMGVAFLATIAVIVIYDRMVTTRQQKTIRNAVYTNQIVSSLFPEQIHNRLLEEQREKNAGKKKHATFLAQNIKSSSSQDGTEGFRRSTEDSRPIADLFPHTTVMLGDLSGFTSWASSREPVQVFQLLETLYGAFDKIAKRRRVFKVETVGDCYVAVAGLPNPRLDHATVMARFARDCILKTIQVTGRLESVLGPDTAELVLRVGLHSGPVTGGVLRGENARFQLFGDTINTAARMESTSLPNHIQVSKETADLLIQDGKSDWLTRREEPIYAKGKGELETFWLNAHSEGTESRSSSDVATEESSNFFSSVSSDEAPKVGKKSEPTDSVVEGTKEIIHDRSTLFRTISARERFIESSIDFEKIPMKTKRLISWNSSLLMKRMEAIVQERHTKQLRSRISTVGAFDSLSRTSDCSDDADNCPTLDEKVVSQLHEFVSVVAALYNQSNAFHNFEHASHVVMSVNKLLSRVVTTASDESQHHVNENQNMPLHHDFTEDIASDAVMQLAVVLSALIHDVDHSGVPNAQLVKENHELARRYENKSVAENHSIERSWDIFMNPRFSDLRECICPSQDDLERFHALVVNTVLATDIVDKELKAERNNRWDKVFSDSLSDDDDMGNTNETDRRKHLNMLKAKIVVEHLIQASDVSHTMQHWHVYCKWNERLFEEMWNSYQSGRSEMNPVNIWYNGELGFFDYYIIPLTKKLDECGVFGVSSHEYLSYAVQNRNEWQLKGKGILQDYITKYCGDETSC